MLKSFFNYTLSGALVLIFMLGVSMLVTNGTAFHTNSFEFTQWLFSILYWIICLATAYWAGYHSDIENQRNIDKAKKVNKPLTRLPNRSL